MKKITIVLLTLLIVFLLSGNAVAARLQGIILQDNGQPLINTSITIQGKNIKTNAFGGYRVVLSAGTIELDVIIGTTRYRSQPITIYSPITKQNWRLDTRNNRLIRIR